MQQTQQIIDQIEKFNDTHWGELIGPVDKSVPTAKEASATATLISWASEQAECPLLILGGKLQIWAGTHYIYDKELFDSLVRPALKRLGLFASLANQPSFLKDVDRSLTHITSMRSHRMNMAPRGINFKDGVLFMTRNRSEFVKGHNANDVFTYCLPFNYEGERTESKVWSKFIKQIVPNDTIRDYVLCSFANSLACDPMKAQRMIMLMGVGASGKSTLIDAVTATIGDDNSFNVDDLKNLTKDDSRFRMDLANHILCICGDASGNIGNKDVLKQIIAKEEIGGRKLYSEVEYFTPRASLIVASNEMGFTHELGDSGISRRIDIIKFDNPVAEADRDPHIGEKLAAPNEQREMILDMVDAIKAMQEQHGKMIRPQSLSDQMNDLMHDGDSFLSFLGWAGIEIASKADKGDDVNWLFQAQIREAYNRYAGEYGCSTLQIKSVKAKCRFHGADEKHVGSRQHDFKFKIVDTKNFHRNFEFILNNNAN
jgi:phage/plasmid-associated DNA primase